MPPTRSVRLKTRWRATAVMALSLFLPSGSTTLSAGVLPSATSTPTATATFTPTATVTSTRVTDLELTMSASPEPVQTGQILTYTQILTNLGPRLVLTAGVSDALPPQVTFVSCSIQGVGFASSSCVDGNSSFTNFLGPGGQATITITAVVNAASGTITNSATAFTSGIDSDPTNNTATVTSTIGSLPTGTPSATPTPTSTTPTPMTTSTPTPTPLAGADLTGTKFAFPNPVLPNQDLTYTITVSNAGPGVASGVAVDDPLPAGTTFVSCTTGQGTCAGPPVGANGMVTAAIGSMAPATSESVTIVVRVTASSGTLSNAATIRAASPDPNPGNNVASSVMAVGAGVGIPLLSWRALLFLAMALAAAGALLLLRY